MVVTPGGLYCRCRARTTSSAEVPLSPMHPVVWMLSPEYESKMGSGKYMWIPPSALTTFMKLSKFSSTKC